MTRNQIFSHFLFLSIYLFFHFSLSLYVFFSLFLSLKVLSFILVCGLFVSCLSIDLLPFLHRDIHTKRGKGHYYENHNIENQKEHRKICKPSQRRKWLLSWSQLRHHNVENGFLVDHYIEKNEKNIKKISFAWFSHFDYLWHKYLWHFGVNKNFLTWLNLT